MVNPTGYTALDLVGFSDKGAYSSAATYVKNDLAHYAGNVWRCLLDDTTAITPAEGLNWTIFIAEPSNAVESSIAPIETSPAEADHAVNTQLYYNDTLYKVIAAIDIGDTLTVGTNIQLADNITTQLSQKANTSSLANVATSGSYSDLSNKPTLGTAAAKDTTNVIAQNSTDPVESGAVYTSETALGSRIDAVDEEIAPIESGTVASQAYAIGDHFIKNDVLYKAKTAIAQGETLTLNTNYEVADNVTDQLASLKEALANTKDSVTSIDITGATNNTGSTIASRTFFYLNGALVRAKTDIANGATLTLNTNYELVTAGGLNELNNDLIPTDVSDLFTPTAAVNSVLYKRIVKCGKVVQGGIVLSPKAANGLIGIVFFNIDSSIMPYNTQAVLGYVRKGGETTQQPLLAFFEETVSSPTGLLRAQNNGTNNYIGAIATTDNIIITFSYITK